MNIISNSRRAWSNVFEALLCIVACDGQITPTPIPRPSIGWIEELNNQQNTYAPGSVLVIRGSDLSSETAIAPPGNWPKTLGGAQVFAYSSPPPSSPPPTGWTPLGIGNVSPNEIRVHLPYSHFLRTLIIIVEKR